MIAYFGPLLILFVLFAAFVGVCLAAGTVWRRIRP